MPSLQELLNDDILCTICEHLDAEEPFDWEYRTEKRKALVCCAHVCQAFYLPATRVLWRRFENLLPLFDLLPSFTKIGEDSGTVETWMLTDEISPDDWEQFKFHASHIRYLGSVQWASSRSDRQRRKIAPANWTYISRLTSGEPLLPNLRELVFRWVGLSSTEILHIVSPSLHHLDIDISQDSPLRATPIHNRQEWETSYQSLLSMVFSMTPRLNTLGFGSDELRMATVSPSFNKLQSLRGFSTGVCDKVDFGTLRTLSALPNLEYIILGRISISRPINPPISGFSNLQTLILHDHPSSNHFYDIFSSPRLAELKITQYPFHLAASFTSNCELWACRFPSLRTFLCRWEEPEYIRLNAQPPQSLAQAIKPLFSIRTMSDVSLEYMENQFSVNDADILEIAMAWPCLTRLNLEFVSLRICHPTSDHDASPVTGAASLIVLAASCPSLRSLHLPRLELRNPLLEQLERLPVLSHPLERLQIGIVEFDDVALAGLLIDRLFPHVRTLSPEERSYKAERLKRFWETVWVCQTARRQQEQRTHC